MQGTIDLGIALSRQAQGKSEGGGDWTLWLFGAAAAGFGGLGIWYALEQERNVTSDSKNKATRT